jgi:ABC-type multidrug transport system ATPase subunit
VENLSGGEMARLLFSRIGVTKPTVLVLDEPTNHLDMEGIESLSDALVAYDGTILFVSHNRWFVDAVATRVLEITPEGLIDFHGSYADYVTQGEEDHLDVEAVVERAREEKRLARKKRRKEKDKTKKALKKEKKNQGPSRA